MHESWEAHFNPVYRHFARGFITQAFYDERRRWRFRSLISVSSGVVIPFLILAAFGADHKPYFILAMVALFGLSMYADRFTLVGAMTNVQRGQNGLWDVVRLTPLPDKRIVEALYTTAEMRAQQLLMIERAARLGFVVVIVSICVLDWVTFVPKPLAPGRVDAARMAVETGINLFTMSAFYVPIVAVVGVVALLEPRARLQSAIALGLWAGMARGERANLRATVAFLAIRLALFVPLGMVLLINAEFQAQTALSNWNRLDSLLIVYPVLALVCAGGALWLYHQLHGRAYRAAIRHFVRGE